MSVDMLYTLSDQDGVFYSITLPSSYSDEMVKATAYIQELKTGGRSPSEKIADADWIQFNRFCSAEVNILEYDRA